MRRKLNSFLNKKDQLLYKYGFVLSLVHSFQKFKKCNVNLLFDRFQKAVSSIYLILQRETSDKMLRVIKIYSSHYKKNVIYQKYKKVEIR